MKKWLLIIALLGIAGCGHENVTNISEPAPSEHDYKYQIPEQVEGDLKTGDIQDAGIDLDKISDLIDNRSAYLNSLLIFRYDKLVLEEYYEGEHMKMTSPITWETQTVQFGRTTPHYLASVTKSYMSALIGICLDQGLIENLQVKIKEFYPEYQSLFEEDERKKNITLEHVLTMKAGFAWNGSTSSTAMIYGKEPWAKYVLSQPMENEPGQVFNYNDGLSVLLGDIVTRVSGESSQLFAQEYLFDKIEVEKPFWDVSKWGELGGGWGLWMTPRDMVKFGKLYLNGGQYNGETVISSDWVNKSKTRTTKSEVLYYCYHWWSRTYSKGDSFHTALIAAGAGGQTIFVVPSLDLVVVFTEGDYDSEAISPMDLMQSYIIPACEESN